MNYEPLSQSAFICSLSRIIKRRIWPKVQIPGDLFATTGALVYQPFIGMINTGAKISSSWVLTHENEWKLYIHNMPEMTDLAISAEVILK